MSKKLVIIPTYNEKDNVAAIIQAVMSRQLAYEILIVDDQSPDGTAEIVQKLKSDFPERLHLLTREGKSGLGTAYIDGFRFALENNYDYIFEMDADFSHDPADLDRLLEACTSGNADLAIGSRYTKGGGVKNWPKDRIFLSKGASIYVRLISWMNIKDPTAGFKCYSRKVLANINLDKISFVGYAFQIEMKFAAWQKGFKLVEVPIVFKDRVKGTSKMDSRIISEAVFGVLNMKWKSFFGYYK